MTASLVAVHVLLAVLLFFLVNWIGRHSISSGYLQLSLFAKADEAPAFNFLFRVLAPVVYLVLVAALLYSVGLDVFVHEIFLVAVYYVVIRWMFNIVTERGRLLNWPSQLVVGAAVCSLAYLTDSRIIAHREQLLPDFSAMAPSLWLVVLVFLYQTLNRITVSHEGTLRRKSNYLSYRFDALNARYGTILDQETRQNRCITELAYAVLIYETFNRPTVYRWLESRLLLPLGLARSLGPMQVQSDHRISDEESVRLGVRKLRDDYAALGGRPEGDESSYALIGDILRRYNVRSDYPEEVTRVYYEIQSRRLRKEIADRRASATHPGTEPTP